MTITKHLGAGALLLGLAASFAGSPYIAARGYIDVDDIAQLIAQGADHIAPVDLARWIRERRPQLRVIDVRRPAEFAQYAIPTAQNIPLESLPRSSFAADETVVLYSEGGAHAAQAWMLLRAMGHRSVYFISGGLLDWYVDVMRPVLSPTASSAERAAFEATAELSRYFGGVPQLAPASATQTPAVQETAPTTTLRRRGC